jgi:hypothetical protein
LLLAGTVAAFEMPCRPRVPLGTRTARLSSAPTTSCAPGPEGASLVITSVTAEWFDLGADTLWQVFAQQIAPKLVTATPDHPVQRAGLIGAYRWAAPVIR